MSTNGNGGARSVLRDDLQMIERTLGLFIEPGGIIEIRALDASSASDRREWTYSGYFDADHLADAARSVAALNAPGKYLTANPPSRVLLARACNRLRACRKGDATTTDRDIDRRRWLLVDCDPQRPKGISSADIEHAAALRKANDIREALRSEGWPDPILADSGNGAHLVYAIDLPRDDGGLVERTLKKLAAPFDDENVKVDTSVSNPARIWKIYGTIARKGDDTPDRPHRLARLIDVPETLAIVTREQLEAFAGPAPSKSASPAFNPNGNNHHSRFDVEAWIQEHDLIAKYDLRGPEPWQGGEKWTFGTCPADPAHNRREAFLIRHAGGAIAAGCQHASCPLHDGRWAALRDLIEPGRTARRTPAAGAAEPADDGPLPIWTDGDHPRLIPLNVSKNILAKRRMIHVAGVFHEYAGGVYRKHDDYQYEREAVAQIGQSVKRGALLDVMKLLQVLVAVDPDCIYRNGRKINLLNGILDLDNGLLPHTPDFISTTQIPIAFDPYALCPTWEKTLSEWFPAEPDMVDLICDWFGYCLIPDTRQCKVMVLLGEGANGKSVLCEILKALVGNENVAAVSLNSLSRSFALAELYGKLVNLTLEADIRDGIDESNFKAAVSGDPIQAERKFRDPFVFRPFARFTISTNNLFHVDDRSDAFYRRLLIVRFGRTFAEDQQDRDLPAKLAAELPGILNWALAGLARLEKRGRFLIPKRVLAEVADYRRQNNPVAAWADENCEIGPLFWEPSSALYDAYRKWAIAEGHKPMASNKFGIEMQRIPGVQKHPDGRRRGFQGVKLCSA